MYEKATTPTHDQMLLSVGGSFSNPVLKRRTSKTTMATSERVAAAGTAFDGADIDDDNFNSFLESMLSSCDEPTAITAILEVGEGGGTNKGGDSDITLGENTQEANGGKSSAATDTGIARATLTGAEIENISSTGMGLV